MTMRFGDFTALDNVTMRVEAGSFHALLGENGAGKSTLVKCMMGFNRPTDGELLVNDRQEEISDPVDAQRHGLGMVYQHFTLVPSLTGKENLVISRADTPQVINWAEESRRLDAFLETMPFRAPLDRPVSDLSAGEKQRLEILKQLYLGSRFLILDEPTSVLTPAEADEILGHVRSLCTAGQLTALMITHKFREVTAFADHVTVLRRGKKAGSAKVGEVSNEDLTRMMVGKEVSGNKAERRPVTNTRVLELANLRAPDKTGLKTIEIDELQVHAGEIVGIAGISGNGQKELMEMLTGQRPLTGGEIRVKDRAYGATRAESIEARIRFLPEEPLQNACAARMSVAENLAFRTFDHSSDGARRLWNDTAGMQSAASGLIAEFNIKTTSPHAPVGTLSGGNVQRTVLARELTGDVDLLIVANPCFGLDIASVTAIRERLVESRNRGVAILLISEDLDEILEVSDRVAVMSGGRIVHTARIDQTDSAEIGRYMAGG
ncbi:ABC transporter ATP-binding protein [Oricola sp.]|uniref:ABC transporter ATP-binding protein n=1 Tax=Oricola sp. TaxID=1979950 RepID=UPI003BABACD7